MDQSTSAEDFDGTQSQKSEATSATDPAVPNDLEVLGPALNACENGASSHVLRAHIAILATRIVHAVGRSGQADENELKHYKNRTDALAHLRDLDLAAQQPDEHQAYALEIQSLRDRLQQAEARATQRASYSYPTTASPGYNSLVHSVLMGPPNGYPNRTSQSNLRQPPSPGPSAAPLVHIKRESDELDPPSKRARLSKTVEEQIDERESAGTEDGESYDPEGGESQLERAMLRSRRRSLGAGRSRQQDQDGLALLAESAVSVQGSQVETEPAMSQQPVPWDPNVFQIGPTFTLPADLGSFISDVHDPTRYNNAYYSRAAANEYGPAPSQDAALPVLPTPPVHLREHSALSRQLPNQFVLGMPSPSPVAGPSVSHAPQPPQQQQQGSDPTSSDMTASPPAPVTRPPARRTRRSQPFSDEEEEDDDDDAMGDMSTGGSNNKKRSPYIKWSLSEDEHLIRAICINGAKWEAVSKLVPNRTYHQCRQRFLRGLKSGSNLPAELKHYAPNMHEGINRYASQRQRSGKPKAPALAATLEAPRMPLPDPVFI